MEGLRVLYVLYSEDGRGGRDLLRVRRKCVRACVGKVIPTASTEPLNRSVTVAAPGSTLSLTHIPLFICLFKEIYGTKRKLR